MTHQASTPWANLPTPTKPVRTKESRDYDTCPRCGVNEKRVPSRHCFDCAAKYRADELRIKSIVKKFVTTQGRVRFHFRDDEEGLSQIDDGLYETVTIEWVCKHAWCAKAFTTTNYKDEWVLNDAEAVCPRCGSSLVLSQCDARLLGQEAKDGS